MNQQHLELYEHGDTEGETQEAMQPFDPVQFLTSEMLKSASHVAVKKLPYGLYIFQGPTDEWCGAIKETILTNYFGAQLKGRRRRIEASDQSQLYVFDFSSKSNRSETESFLDRVLAVIAQDAHVVIVSGPQTDLPTILKLASDKTFIVAGLRQREVSALIKKMIPGVRRLDFQDLRFEALTPSMIRLAYRRGIGAREFIRRLKVFTDVKPHNNTTKVVPLRNLHGVDEVKKWATELKCDIDHYRHGRVDWDQLSAGVLLCGPPGTGKTTLAASIADFCKLAFVSTSYASWQRAGEGHLGDVLRAMASSFAEARRRAPSLLFIDELDTVGSRTADGKNNDWWRSVINALLEQMAGPANNEGVVICGASNFPDLIDHAILRSGRLEEHIFLSLPDASALTNIYRDQLGSEFQDVDALQDVGRISQGFTGADVIKVCKKARRHARSAGRNIIFDDLIAAIEGGKTSLDGNHIFRAAIHESGHAIAAISSPALRLGHVTIVANGDKKGGTAIGWRSGVITPSALGDYLVATLAGRAAEEVFFEEVSAGAGGRPGSDLSIATRLAVEAELSLGIGTTNLIWFDNLSNEKVIDLFSKRRDIENAVRKRLADAYLRALQVVRSRAPLVEKIAEQLLVKRVLSADEIEQIISTGLPDKADLYPRRMADKKWLN
jgi:ATP-dependent Zn protease